MLLPNRQPIGIEQLGGAIRASIGPANATGATSVGPIPIPAPLGKRMGLVLAGDMKGHFERGSGPNGERWAPIQPRPQGGSKPLLNTGRLRASIKGRAERDGASAGTNAIQANLMNAGGTIRPIKAKFLAIPLTREAVRAGSPRDFPRELFVIRTKNGHLLLVEHPPRTRTGKIKKRRLNDSEKMLASQYSTGSSFVAQYVLKKSVVIPARPFNGFTDGAIEDVTLMATDYLLGEPEGQS
ncbi:MAG: phage virion morphogenesis protein [Gemmataceae bacterium]